MRKKDFVTASPADQTYSSKNKGAVLRVQNGAARTICNSSGWLDFLSDTCFIFRSFDCIRNNCDDFFADQTFAFDFS